jgi:hypothetical protein
MVARAGYRSTSTSTTTAAGGINVNVNVNVNAAAAASSTSSSKDYCFYDCNEKASNPKAVANWARLVTTAGRVRRLQRYFGHIGQFLQTFGKKTRDGLIKHYPKQ